MCALKQTNYRNNMQTLWAVLTNSLLYKHQCIAKISLSVDKDEKTTSNTLHMGYNNPECKKSTQRNKWNTVIKPDYFYFTSRWERSSLDSMLYMAILETPFGWVPAGKDLSSFIYGAVCSPEYKQIPAVITCIIYSYRSTCFKCWLQ